MFIINILKDKGIITDEEINDQKSKIQKFIQAKLDAAKKGSPESTVQSEGTGDTSDPK